MFSRIEDPNRVIPLMRGKNLNNAFQGIILLVALIFIGIPLLPGELGNWAMQYSDYIFIPFIIVIFGLSIGSAAFNNWLVRRNWEALAADFSLQFDKGGFQKSPKLEGTFRGHKISVEITSVSRGRSRTYYTNFLVYLPQAVTHKLTITKRSLVSLNRETIGDEEIDKKLTISTSSIPLLRRILGNNRTRRGLLELGERNRLKEIVLMKNFIHYTEQSRISDTVYLQAVLRYLTEMANLVDRFDKIGY